MEIFEVILAKNIKSGMSLKAAMQSAIDKYPEIHKDFINQKNNPGSKNGICFFNPSDYQNFKAAVKGIFDAEGVTYGKAVVLAAHRYPQLHQKYIDSINGGGGMNVDDFIWKDGKPVFNLFKAALKQIGGKSDSVNVNNVQELLTERYKLRDKNVTLGDKVSSWSSQIDDLKKAKEAYQNRIKDEILSGSPEKISVENFDSEVEILNGWIVIAQNGIFENNREIETLNKKISTAVRLIEISWQEEQQEKVDELVRTIIETEKKYRDTMCHIFSTLGVTSHIYTLNLRGLNPLRFR